MDSTVEAYDAELFAMLKSIQHRKAYIQFFPIKDIWIFSDNQAAVQRISQNSSTSGQRISYKMQCEAESLLADQKIQLHICWVPDHAGVYGNEQADKAAKIAAVAEDSSKNIIDCISEIGASITYLKSQVKKSLLQSWYDCYFRQKRCYISQSIYSASLETT